MGAAISNSSFHIAGLPKILIRDILSSLQSGNCLNPASPRGPILNSSFDDLLSKIQRPSNFSEKLFDLIIFETSRHISALLPFDVTWHPEIV